MLLLVCLNAVIDAILGTVIGLILVARWAGKNSKAALIGWLDSDEANPYYDRIADRAAARFDKKISDVTAQIEGMKADVAKVSQIQFDGTPVVNATVAQVTPILEDQISRLKSWWEGKRGILSRSMKELGEGALDAAGAAALAEGQIDAAALLEQRLGSLKIDEEWAKAHPYAALGLEYLKSQVALGGNAIKLTRTKSPAGRGEFG